jgi:ketosteroid isomerase-like protein
MSAPGNTEVLRRSLEAFNSRDLDAWLELADPELVNVPPKDWPEQEPIRGARAAWDFYVEAQDAWQEESAYSYGEVLEISEETVLADMRAELHGKASGAEVLWRYWQVVEFRDGRMARVQWYSDRADAMAALD